MPQSKIVVLRNGKPVSNVKVTLEFIGLANIGFTKPVFTDAYGIALIQHASNGQVIVYLNGREWGKIHAPNEDTFFL